MQRTVGALPAAAITGGAGGGAGLILRCSCCCVCFCERNAEEERRLQTTAQAADHTGTQLGVKRNVDFADGRQAACKHITTSWTRKSGLSSRVRIPDPLSPTLLTTSFACKAGLASPSFILSLQSRPEASPAPRLAQLQHKPAQMALSMRSSLAMAGKRGITVAEGGVGRGRGEWLLLLQACGVGSTSPGFDRCSSLIRTCSRLHRAPFTHALPASAINVPTQPPAPPPGAA